MPRAASRSAARGLSLRSGTGIPGKELVKNDNARKRSALGEITNASNKDKEERQKSLKKQVKKGLSNIVNSSKTLRATGLTSKNKEKRIEEPKRSSRRLSARVSTENSSTSLSTSKSLSSSQEEESVKQLKETFQKSSSDFLSESDVSDYLSAEESPNVSVVAIKDFRYIPPERPTPPSDVLDFDLENEGDTNAVSEYVADVFQYYKERESLFTCPDYMSTQPDITVAMRAILVDWLVEVQESFELNHETLYTSVRLMDLYCSKKRVPREDLQLVGATACFIACKVDERTAPSLDDFVYVCDDAYSKRDIIRRELEMIDLVGYDVGYPLSYRFLRRYGRVCKVNMPELTLARYILEMSLLDYQFNVMMSESKLAAAALVLALKVKKVSGWEKALHFYSNYTLEDLEGMVQKLHKMIRAPPVEHAKTIRLKYSHRVFHEVASTVFPAEIN